jgi:hypothetical protein
MLKCYRSAMDLRRLRSFLTVAELGLGLEGGVAPAYLRAGTVPANSRGATGPQAPVVRPRRALARVDDRRRAVAGKLPHGAERRAGAQRTCAAVAPRRCWRVAGGGDGVAYRDDVLEISPSVRAALSERRDEIDRIVRPRPRYGGRGDVHVGLTATDPAAIDDSRIGIYPVMPLGLLAASRPSFPLKAQRSTQTG